jgi:hypothetical protein
MKSLKFNFCHPIKGNACLMLHSKYSSKCQNMLIDSKNSNLIEIPIDGCKEGKWSVVLNWEYDGSSFSHRKEFEVKKENR